MFLYKIKQIAEILNCSERHVWTLITNNELKIIKIGSRSTRISDSDLQSFVAQKSGAFR